MNVGSSFPVPLKRLCMPVLCPVIYSIDLYPFELFREIIHSLQYPQEVFIPICAVCDSSKRRQLKVVDMVHM